MRHVIRDDVEWDVQEYNVANYDFWGDFENAQWEQYTLDVVSKYARIGTTVVDIGAFVGPITMWANSCGADVVAVEPDPVAMMHLRNNCAENAPFVTIVEGAISNHTGHCQIAPHVDGWGSSMTQVSDVGRTVPCWTLIDLFDVLELENVSLVKMDIEGGEALILEDVAPFLASQGIPLLAAMHEPWWSRPVERSWFDGYNEIIGDFVDFGQILALP